MRELFAWCLLYYLYYLNRRGRPGAEALMFEGGSRVPTIRASPHVTLYSRPPQGMDVSPGRRRPWEHGAGMSGVPWVPAFFVPGCPAGRVHV